MAKTNDFSKYLKATVDLFRNSVKVITTVYREKGIKFFQLPLIIGLGGVFVLNIAVRKPLLTKIAMEPFLLSSSLALVAAQRLVRALCPHCKEAYKPEQRLLDQIMKEAGFTGPVDRSKWVFYKPRGCDRCAKTGYSGRRAIYEVFLVNEEMRRIIYKTQDLVELRAATRRSGA